MSSYSGNQSSTELACNSEPIEKKIIDSDYSVHEIKQI